MSTFLIFLLLFLVLALIRIPVAYSMSIATVVSMVVSGISLKTAGIAVFNGLNSFTFLAIPAFILAGEIMGVTGISTTLIEFIESIIGRLRGALGAAAVITSLLFGTLTGSSLATVTAIGTIMIPDMEKRGYDRAYSGALIAASGFLGILIPPSIPGIVYAMMSGENLMAVWLCTVMPGIMIGVGYIIVNYFIMGRKEKKITEPFKVGPYVKNVGISFKNAILAIMMPVIIFYGIYGGIFTPTEAGGVAVFYGLLVGWVILPLTKKRWPSSKFFNLISESAISTASITIIIGLSAITGKMIIFSGVPQQLTEILLGVTDSKVVFLILVNLLLLVAGMFMETNSAILLLGPILIPVAEAYGVETIHFAAIMLLNMEIGMITPPMAGNLFVAARLSGKDIGEILKHIAPFYAVAIIVLIITTYVPQVIVWLPHMLY
ncbi:MAG: TRAP transporter large permease [Firmicutes bacterium]|nr:TRAP transporter large permease [Bacillota bacterium]